MFKNESIENLLDNLEQELIEIESPEKVKPQAKERKKNDPIEPPSHKTSLIDVFEEAPKPQARERNIFAASTSKAMEKQEKNDENEIIQLSSISSDILRSSQSSPTQTSSFHSNGKPGSSVMVVNEKKKPNKKTKVQVIKEAAPESDSFFTVTKHGKWAKEDVPRKESLQSQKANEDKIEIQEDENDESDAQPKKIEKPKKLKLKNPKKVSSSSSSVATSLPSSTLSSSSEEEIPPEPIKKKSKEKKSKKKKKISKKKLDSGSEDDEGKTEETSGESAEDSKEPLQEIENLKAIGIFIHDTGKLEYNTNLKQPRIKVSFFNEDNGNLINKSVGKSPIETLFSKKGAFNDDYFHLTCTWNEVLTINEDIHRLKELYNNVLIFFEMINENNVNLCWAFLKIFSPTFMNIDEKLKLQFYEYQRPKKILKFRGKPLGEKKELSVYEQWQHKNRRKFPSYLNVTVKSLEVRKKQDDPEKKESQVETVAPENLAIFSNWRKLPGQACKIPNKLLHKSIFHEKGSMIVKFSHDGNFLAFTEIQKHNFILRVMKFPEMTDTFTLSEHTDLIHDIDWSKDKTSTTMLSSSSDYTAIVWKLEGTKYTYNILPHPCFIYASKFLDGQSLIATGGRDSIIRIWKVKKSLEGFELHQELSPSEDTKDIYITAIATKSLEYFYSSNSAGQIFEWKFNGKKYSLNRLFDLDELSQKIITCIDLHSRGNKLYIKVFDFSDANPNNSIFILGIPSGLIIQKFRVNGNTGNFVNFGLHSKLKCSPCGTILFSTDLANKERICYFQLVNGNINTNNLSENNFLHVKFHLGEMNFISSLDYHPKDFYVAYSIYGKNGGIGVYGFDVDKNYNERVQNLAISRVPANPAETSGRKTEIKHFSDIIRRLDEVFLIPNERNIKATEQTHSRDHSEKENTYTVESKRSNTYTVAKKPEVPEKPPRKVKENESDNNLTYSIKNNTYDVQKGHNSDDDTTISQSLN